MSTIEITQATVEACAGRAVTTLHEAREVFTAGEFLRDTDEAAIAIAWRAAVVAELQALRACARRA